jgi:hypothetical protein
MTYLDIVLKELTYEDNKSINDIMIKNNIPKYKSIHVIGGIKKGIELNLIIKHVDPNVKNLYAGHLYSLK